MPFAFPYGVANLFRVDMGYKSSDNENFFDAVFYYQANISGGYAAEMGSLFIDNVVPDITALMSDQVDTVLINVVNLGSDTDVYNTSLEVASGISGTLMSPWQCSTFRMATGNRLAPYGWKRFGYVTENMVTAKGVIESSLVGTAVSLAAALIQEFDGALPTYSPVLVSPANQSHDTDLVLPFAEAIFQKMGHDVGRKSY
jgi:hypothetical protein